MTKKGGSLRAALERVKKWGVGATIGRPQILLCKIRRRKAKKQYYSLQKIRKTLFFGGRAMLAPTFILKNRVL